MSLKSHKAFLEGLEDTKSTLSCPASSARRPLRVLSLDGGGVRGLSSLLILRRIMYNIQPTDDLYRIIKPYDVFDMICGTSTGGLIAIMLGRLRMGIQETIDAYLSLAKDVFQEKPQSLLIPGVLGAMAGRARFSGEKLATAVKRVVEKQTGDENACFFESREDQCRVFVCATRTANTEPAIMRSYRSDEEDSAQGTIWQVARATSAAPTFFSSITFGNPPANYVDGAMVHNNPIRLLMREVTKVWGDDAELFCVLSIGTGTPTTRKLGTLGHQILSACAKLATHAENIARDFKADQGGRLQKEGKYFRFNVAQGLQGVKLEEWQAFDLMDASTRTYLNDVELEVDACSRRLGKGTEGETMSQLTQEVLPSFPRSVETELKASIPSSSPTIKAGFRASLPPAPSLTGHTAPEYVDIIRASSRYFTGRTEVLKSLQQYFSSVKRASARVAVLIGLGGMGKTQTALQYFEHRRSSYSIALFVECNTKQECIEAFVRFAHLVVDEELRQFPESTYIEAVQKLGFSGLLKEQNQSKQSPTYGQMRVVEAVKRWLGRQQGTFLIIFDNADEPSSVNLDKFVPSHRNGDIIITTRDKAATAFGQPFPIEEMPKDEAVALLEKASNMIFDTKARRDTAAEIAKTLGYLPLAIDQAGGYLTYSDSDLADFLPTYALHARSLLSQVPNDGMLGYKQSAFTTWEMSFERLQILSKKSAELLQVLGFINNQDICDRLYKTGNGIRNATISMPTFMKDSQEWSTQEDAFGFHEAFTCLSKLCLVKRNDEAPGTRTYNIHPVVHVWIRERLSPKDRALYARDALLLVAQSLPSLQQSKAKAWAVHRRLYPHTQAAWTNVKQYAPPSNDGREVAILDALDIVATSFRQQGHYELAEEVLFRAYQGSKRAYGPLDRKTLHNAERLASVYDIRGEFKKAEALYRLLFDSLTNVLGPGNRKTLAALQNLANVLKYRGKSDEAERSYKQALEGRKRFGEEDADTLETMDALASLYYASSRPQEAEPLRLFVLKAREKRFGADNLETLGTVLDMGMLYSGLGDNERTLELFEKAYESRMTLFDAPPTEKILNALSVIAAFYANLGHMERAETMYQEVLSRQKFLLGDLHLDTIWTQCCLGVVLFIKERSAQSIKQVEKAFADIGSKLGPNHLDTLWVAHALAIVYECWDKIDEAEQLQERVVKGFLDELGPHHVNTLYMINDLGDCYSRGKKMDKAETSFRKAFEGKLKCFGFRSPHTLYTATLLAATMRELGNEKEAEDLFKRVLETTTDLLGSEHADATVCMMYLADLYVGQQRFKEARDLYQKVSCWMRWSTG
ncbi:tetratricopeptide repeat domain-containing protein [Penicillium canescens]|uniref:Tetratricopeptide repeat domain-containing protein n=1 Tax=Penicillium canescens TaxID=5083 RepID=A0AAD6I6G6_PENCN|nr:tetratricopeptide repeat domain-containing protein [Penicillium canescens]KAJ6030963.1 tetratricopeptide repeat domain-containing protein [Penicillium canescens]KAJ6042983.1 tetratricopeptide repeat domain-containing protein [Penicillium canescens]KAJ6063486.1 tetratricopeptide repeat domain-containing protein [Penicillium canescens]